MDIILSFDNYCLFKGIQKIPLKEIEDNDKNLKELHFNFVQLDKIEFNLMLDLLCKNTSIRKLDLGNILYDKNNKIGNDEFKKIIKLIKVNNTITDIELGFEDLDEILIKEFYINLNFTKNLKILKFTNCGKISGWIFNSIKMNQYLYEIHLPAANIDEKAAIELSKIIKENHILKYINIGINGIKGNEAKIIFNELKNNTMLLKFEIHDNMLDDECSESIAEMLKFNSTLKKLNICCNEFTIKGIEIISKSLELNKGLEFICLDSTKLNINSGLINIIKKNTKLKSIKYWGWIDGGEVPKIFDALNFNTTLKKIKLTTSNVYSLSVSSIANYINQNTTLEKLEISQWYAGFIDNSKIVDAIYSTKTLKYIYFECDNKFKNLIDAMTYNNNWFLPVRIANKYQVFLKYIYPHKDLMFPDLLKLMDKEELTSVDDTCFLYWILNHFFPKDLCLEILEKNLWLSYFDKFYFQWKLIKN
jgi:hypothetical protein